MVHMTEETIELPDTLSYPEILPLENIKDELINKLVYIIQDYDDGIALNILINGEDNVIRFSDWDGKLIEPLDNDLALQITNNYLANILQLLNVIKLSKCIIYIGRYKNDLAIVDVRTSLNKFVGPGMIRDLFSQVMETQRVNKVMPFEESTIEAIQDNKGSFEGNLIIKPSVFSTIENNQILYPLYGRVIRKTKKDTSQNHINKYHYQK